MYFSEYLRRLGGYFFEIGTWFTGTGAQIAGVYLIGGYLGNFFFNIGARFIGVAIDIYNASVQFDVFYNEVRGNVGGSQILQTLLAWANQIIDFIQNREHYIREIVRAAFSGIDQVLHATYNFILPHVLSIIRNNFSFLSDLKAWLLARLGEFIPNFSIFRSSPVQWVIDRIKAYSIALSRFISDPDGYIKEKLYIFFPSLKLFFDDPANYIIEKLSEKLETFAERNLMRLVKIVENALNNIF